MTKRPSKVKKHSQLKLVTPRRNWRRYDSVVQRQYNSRACAINSKIRREQQLRGSHTRSNATEITNDVKDSDALKWVESMIKRGRSILSSLSEDERAFKQEILEDERRSTLHDSLVESILKRKDEDVSRNGYGTDTSFKNMNSMLYNSFVDSEDVNMDYSLSETNTGVDVHSVNGPQAEGAPVEGSNLHSDFYEDNSEDRELNIDLNEELRQNISPEDHKYGVEPIETDVVEVLSVTSQEDEVSEENNYTSEKEEQEYLSESGDEEVYHDGTSEHSEEDDAVQDFDDEVRTEVSMEKNRRQVSDSEVLIEDEGSREENSISLSHEERAEDRYVQILSDEGTSDEDLGGSLADEDTAMSETLTRTNNFDAAFGDETNIQGTQQEEPSPHSSPDSSSPRLYGSTQEEGLRNDKQLLNEAAKFGELNKAEILHGQELGQDVRAQTQDKLPAEIGDLVNKEKSTEHQLPDMIYYKAIAQAAAGNGTLEDSNVEIGPEFGKLMNSHLDRSGADDFEDAEEIVEDEGTNIISGNRQGSGLEVDAPENQPNKTQNVNEVELNMNSLTPDLIEVEIGAETSDHHQADDDADKNISSVNETTIYHSFDSSNSEPILTRSSSQHDIGTTGYQIVFASSAYSTTSCEDSRDIMEPTGEYVSPLTENPFSIQQDENAFEVLRRTLASLSRTEVESAASDRKPAVSDRSISSDAAPEHISQVLQQDTQPELKPELTGIDSNQSKEEEISEYVKAVLEASKRTEGLSDSENESPDMRLEELESNMTISSLPVVQTEPWVEVSESVSRTLIPLNAVELRASAATISESVDDGDVSEDEPLPLVQTRPIIKIPSIEEFDTNTLEFDHSLKTDCVRRAHTVSRRDHDTAGKQSDELNDRSPSKRMEHPQNSANEVLQTSQFTSPDPETGDIHESIIKSNSVGTEKSNEEQVKVDRARGSSKRGTPSFPRKLLSSPLRAISSLVSGIKEVGNVASDFVRTLDVLNNDDSDEASAEMENGSQKNPIECDQENTSTNKFDTNDQKPNRGKPSEPGVVPDIHIDNTLPSIAGVQEYRTGQDLSISPVEEVTMQDDKKTLIQDVDIDLNDHLNDIKNDGTASAGSEHEDRPEEISPRYDTPTSDHPAERSSTEELHSGDPKDQEPRIPQMVESENVLKAQIIIPAQKKDSPAPQSRDPFENECRSPVQSFETTSQIRTLQHLADSVCHMPCILPNEDETSELIIEDESLRNPVDIEVDAEIEINVERSSTTSRDPQSNLIPETETYPIESTLISGVGSSTKLRDQMQAASPGAQNTEQNSALIQGPLRGLHDQIKYRLPSYLPSDPPSEDDTELKTDKVIETDHRSKGLNQRTEVAKSPSNDRESPADLKVAALPAEVEDVKEIPVKCDDRRSDIKIPVVIERTPSANLKVEQQKDKPGQDRNNLVDKVQDSKEQHAQSTSPKRKRPRDNTIGNSRSNKRNKKQFKGRRKGKKKGPVIRKKY